MEQNMEYPFGFGFELMKNPDAMKRFSAMNDEEKREMMKRISGMDSPDEMRKFLAELASGAPIAPLGQGRTSASAKKRPTA